MSQAISKLASGTVRGRRLIRKEGRDEAASPGNAIVAHINSSIDPAERREWIAQAAYFHAERRGFEPGFELEDWCAAEQEIDALLASGERPR